MATQVIDDQVIPPKCRSCFKTSRHIISSNCRFCRDISFPEAILCDLNRDGQSSANEFVCHSFQPMLSLVHPEKEIEPDIANNETSHNELLLSDKIKYNIALNLQKLGRDPDLITAFLKYHIVWNTSQREKTFPESQDLPAPIMETFEKSINRRDIIVLPLWIALDHVHIYVEDTSGRTSIDKIIQKIKKGTEPKLLRILKDANRCPQVPLWDDSYFAATIC